MQFRRYCPRLGAWILCGVATVLAVGGSATPMIAAESEKRNESEVRAALNDLKTSMSRLERAVSDLGRQKGKESSDKLSRELKETTEKLETKIKELQGSTSDESEEWSRKFQANLSSMLGSLSDAFDAASKKLRESANGKK